MRRWLDEVNKGVKRRGYLWEQVERQELWENKLWKLSEYPQKVEHDSDIYV